MLTFFLIVYFEQASIYSLNLSFGNKQEQMQETDVIQMAVLADSYTFEDIKGDVKMDGN